MTQEQTIRAGEEKSKGHVAFYTDHYGVKYELYKDSGGELYRAPLNACIDEFTGNRIGRWEAPSHMADAAAERILK